MTSYINAVGTVMDLGPEIHSWWDNPAAAEEMIRSMGGPLTLNFQDNSVYSALNSAPVYIPSTLQKHLEPGQDVECIISMADGDNGEQLNTVDLIRVHGRSIAAVCVDTLIADYSRASHPVKRQAGGLVDLFGDGAALDAAIVKAFREMPPDKWAMWHQSFDRS